MIKELGMLDKIDQAITNLRRGKQKLTISKIAEKADIARKTIYNRPELKQRCDQAIHIQKQLNKPLEEIATDIEVSSRGASLSRYKLIEERYNRVKGNLKLEREKNARLLENNRQLVLEKDQLKGRILFLENRLEKMRKDKMKSIK